MALKRAINVRLIFALIAFCYILFKLSSLLDRHVVEIESLEDLDQSVEVYTSIPRKESTRSFFTRQNGKYWILYNYVRARYKFYGNESITYTTHGEHTFLDNLEAVISSSLWDRRITEIIRLKDWHEREELTRSLFIRQNGPYWILYNYVQARHKFYGNESITYTTHGEYTYLDNLEELIIRWRAPMSIALYACGSDFEATLNYIRFLRSCSSAASLIEDMVTFHIFFHEDHMPEFVPKTDEEILQFNDCSELAPFLKNGGQRYDTYREINKLIYPINIARNIARHEATTYYVFPLDIELLPSKNFVRDFLEMVGPMKLAKKRSVFVAAIFEMEAGYNLPKSKTELQKMLYKKIAISFHASFAFEYHAIPYLEEWISRKEPDHTEVFKVVKRTNDRWEPFYVTINKEEPYFDEHFSWEGQYDKRIQADLLTTMDYDFLLLDKAFLMHRPGIKIYHPPNAKNAALRLKMAVKAQSIYRTQLQILYGDVKITKKFPYEQDAEEVIKPNKTHDKVEEVVQEIVDNIIELPDINSNERKANEVQMFEENISGDEDIRMSLHENAVKSATFNMEPIKDNKNIAEEEKPKIALAQDVAGKEQDDIVIFESQEVNNEIWNNV